VINPAAGAILGELPLATADDLDRALDTAARGYRLWRARSAADRSRVLSEAAQLLRQLQGKVIPMSGGDFPLVRPDGVIDFDARYLLEADDGTVIYLQNRGFRWAKTPQAAEKMNRNEPVADDEYYMRVSPKFDVPEGPHSWMSKHVFVGVAEKIPGANRIHYFVVRQGVRSTCNGST
jgi:hypothetical protein